jgi:hypothetical protein
MFRAEKNGMKRILMVKPVDLLMCIAYTRVSFFFVCVGGGGACIAKFVIKIKITLADE